jgi:hypothetical protein
MPKFLFTVCFLLTLPLGLLIYILGWVGTISYPFIFLFLTALFLFLSGFLSLIIFYFYYKKTKNENDPRYMYRKALKISSYISLGITMVMFLRGFKLESLLNVFLFLAFYLVLGYQLFIYGRKDR